MCEQKASVIKKLGVPFYEVVLSDYWFTKVDETLGFFKIQMMLKCFPFFGIVCCHLMM